jgi:hypothetical protein
MAVMRQYPYSLDEPLLWFAKDCPWRIRDALEGTAILGDMGSGKTSGSGKTIARAFLKAGFGGLVLCQKTDECESWIHYATECGRRDQLLIVNPRQPWRFNFLDYTFRCGGEGAPRAGHRRGRAAVVWRQRGTDTPGSAVLGHAGHGSWARLPWVPQLVAIGLLGASAAGHRRDDRARWAQTQRMFHGWPRVRAGMLQHSCVRVALGPVRRECMTPPHHAAARAIRPSENGVSAMQWLTDASTLENAHGRPNRFAC